MVPAGTSKAIPLTFATDMRLIPTQKVTGGTQTEERRSILLNKKNGGATAASSKENIKKVDSDCCVECGRRSNTMADERWQSEWVNCSRKGCRRWYHVKCTGYFPKSGMEVPYDEFVEQMQRVHFFCPEHRPAPPRGNILRPSNSWMNGYLFIFSLWLKMVENHFPFEICLGFFENH